MERILRHKAIVSVFMVSAFLVLGGFAWGYFAMRHSPFVILHYGAASFERRLGTINHYGTTADFMRFGILSVVVLFVNFFLALEVARRDRFLGKLITGATLFFSILLFIGVAAIISVN